MLEVLHVMLLRCVGWLSGECMLLSHQCHAEERGERKVTLTVMILLYILRAWMVGINKLQSFYVGALYCDANVEFVPQLVNT